VSECVSELTNKEFEKERESVCVCVFGSRVCGCTNQSTSPCLSVQKKNHYFAFSWISSRRCWNSTILASLAPPEGSCCCVSGCILFSVYVCVPGIAVKSETTQRCTRIGADSSPPPLLYCGVGSFHVHTAPRRTYRIRFCFLSRTACTPSTELVHRSSTATAFLLE
jgi:hypothetical protein